jgi:hypothetical protein
LLLTLMTLAVPASLPAATLTYPGAAPCNTTLQACVTAASAGDTIQLAVNTVIAEFVTIGKTLTIQPAPGFAPRVQALFVFVSTTDVDFTVQNLSGLNSMRALLGPGGGNLGLQVLNNVINGSGYMSAIDVTGGTGTPGTYGEINATVSGNRIRQTPLAGICTDAVAVIGVPVGFKATIVNNDITVNDLSQCGGIDVVVGGGAIATATVDRNLVHGANFDYGILVRNFGNNPGAPGGLLTAQVSNNLVYGQNGNVGAPAGLVVTADGGNAALAAQLGNNTVADGRWGVLVAVRDDLGASVTGGLFNTIVTFNSQAGISIDVGATGFANSHNLIFGNPANFFIPGPGTMNADPLFVNRAAGNYRLASGSPAIDVGLDSALPASFTLDLAGGPRRVGTIDIGAYESASGPAVIFQYAVKFICGKSAGTVVAPGVYFTAINVHNPNDKAIGFRKKFAIALPSERPGPVSKFFDAKLGPDQAFEIDCHDILRRTQSNASFIKGFAVLESDLELDVVAVYTAAGATGRVETMELERVTPRRQRARGKPN